MQSLSQNHQWLINAFNYTAVYEKIAVVLTDRETDSPKLIQITDQYTGLIQVFHVSQMYTLTQFVS